MWQVDKHVARAMVDDRADLEVKQRGLPVPTPNPMQPMNQRKAVPARPPLRRRLADLAYHWHLFCRWLNRLGLPSRCDRVSA